MTDCPSSIHTEEARDADLGLEPWEPAEATVSGIYNPSAHVWAGRMKTTTYCQRCAKWLREVGLFLPERRYD